MDGLRLYELSGAIRDVLDGMALIDEDTGEIIDAGSMDTLVMATEEKIDSCGCYIRELMATHKAYCDEAARIDKKAKATKRRIEWMQGYVGRCMDEAGLDRVDGRHVSVKWRRSSAVDVTDMDSLPEEYVRVTHRAEPDKTRIKAAIRAGIDVPGACIEDRKSLVVE